MLAHRDWKSEMDLFVESFRESLRHKTVEPTESDASFRSGETEFVGLRCAYVLNLVAE